MTGAAPPDTPRAPPRSEDHWRWAEALAVSRMHGDGAEAHAATRVRELLAAGDVPGVERWREIAARLAQLSCGAILQ